jgi:hypothetical protein
VSPYQRSHSEPGNGLDVECWSDADPDHNPFLRRTTGGPTSYFSGYGNAVQGQIYRHMQSMPSPAFLDNDPRQSIRTMPSSTTVADAKPEFSQELLPDPGYGKAISMPYSSSERDGATSTATLQIPGTPVATPAPSYRYGPSTPGPSPLKPSEVRLAPGLVQDAGNSYDGSPSSLENYRQNLGSGSLPLTKRKSAVTPMAFNQRSTVR